ncbi:MAG TPA: TVP38/TMEM64 family protein, partial [Anaerolineae bacterium]|nr:TVP38/TMEM64 family protein [Anaerolineae bacterium]
MKSLRLRGDKRGLFRNRLGAVAGGLILAALLAALVLWRQPIYAFIANREPIRAWVEGLGPWGPAAIILLEAAQTLLAPLPGQAIELVSGYLYGPWWGSLLAMIGIALGSSLAFGLARRFGRPLAVKLAGRRSMDRLDDLAR